MMRSLRMAAVALGAVALMGSTAVAQAADLPSAGTVTYAYTAGTPSPKDIVMHWEGTCTNPGERLNFFADGSNWGGFTDVDCASDGTYRAAIMIYDYEDRGLAVGQSFEYRAALMSITGPAAYSEFSGTATL